MSEHVPVMDPEGFRIDLASAFEPESRDPFDS